MSQIEDKAIAKAQIATLKSRVDELENIIRRLRVELDEARVDLRKAKHDASGTITKVILAHNTAVNRAADLLMDHGIIKTGPELLKVYNQIRSIPFFAVSIEAKDEVPF